ncbi:MAG: lipopolysaccharide biosynthesis protein [Planctomycetota bacterium]
MTYTAKGLQVVLALVCMPIYLQQLGAAGFGIVGLFLSIQRLATLFDSGFSRAINREMASSTDPRTAADTMRTLEVAYLAITATLLIVGLAASGMIASVWHVPEARTLALLVAAAIAFQAPSNYYGAVLAGLERHVTLNLLQIAWQTARFVGGAVVLVYSPNLVAFFSSQLVVAAAFTVAIATSAWRAAPLGFLAARFSGKHLHAVKRYAGGATLCAVTAVLVTQLDKLILCWQLSADEFGLYMLGWSLAGSLFVVVSPMGSVFFPRLSRLASDADSDALRQAYRTGSELVALVILPITSVLAILGWHVLYAWIGEPGVADDCWLVSSLLATGIGVNCLCLMPHTLQMASGWTGLSNRLNLAAIAVFSPGIYFAATGGGAIGAGVAWIVFSCGFLLLQVVLMHRRLLPGELTPWLRTYVVTACGCVVAVGVVAISLPVEGRLGSLAVVVTAWAVAFVVACLLCTKTRRWIEARLLKPRIEPVARPTEPCPS